MKKKPCELTRQTNPSNQEPQLQLRGLHILEAFGTVALSELQSRHCVAGGADSLLSVWWKGRVTFFPGFLMSGVGMGSGDKWHEELAPVSLMVCFSTTPLLSAAHTVEGRIGSGPLGHGVCRLHWMAKACLKVFSC